MATRTVQDNYISGQVFDLSVGIRNLKEQCRKIQSAAAGRGATSESLYKKFLTSFASELEKKEAEVKKLLNQNGYRTI